MRTSTTALLLAAAVLPTYAITLAKRSDGPARVVEHTIHRRHVVDPIQRDRNRMRRRDGTVSVTLTNEETLYFMNATIGTPAQSFELHIDTGSSDLWVNVKDSDECKSGDTCTAYGTYSANDSSTYTYVNSDFNITYDDGSGSSGDYATDTVRFGDISIKNQQFGIGYDSTTAEGILGIGYRINEVAAAYSGQVYANVPQQLLNNGYIESNAYSLWLNDLDSSTGSILFGGVNSDKYTGTLETLPIIKEDGVYAEFLIALTGVGINGTKGSLGSDLDVAALLDSGTSLMYLPDDITQDIYDTFGATYSESEGAAFVPCDLADSDGSIDLTFSSPTISVAVRELVIVAGYEKEEAVCILGVGPAGDSTPVLGDTFLRSAYVVYDLTSNEISLAQTHFNSTSDNILEITNSTGVPGASVVADAVSTVAAATGSTIIDTITSSIASTAQPTAAVGYNVALLGAAGAVAIIAL